MGRALLGDLDLIVTCAECSTSFQLDEARIPATGAQVRCSRCKHSFFLANPTASQTDAIHAAAEEAIAGRGRSVPAATTDLKSASSSSESLSSGALGTEPDLDEEDWQFSEEIRVEGDEPDDDLDANFGGDLSEAPDQELDSDSDFGETPDFSLGTDKAGLALEGAADAKSDFGTDSIQIAQDAIRDAGAGSGLELDSGPEGVTPGRDASSFGSIDDFSELLEDDDSSSSDDLAAEIAAEMEAEAATQSRTNVYSGTSGTGSTDDLGDPESWDLVGSDDFSAGKSALRARQRPLGDAALPAASAADFFGEGELDDASYDEHPFGATLLAGPVGWLGRAVGWTVTAVLVGAVCVLSLRSDWSRWAEAPQIVVAGPLSVETTEAGWVETSRAGPILRFSGELRNTSSRTIWPGVVQLVLLDANGERLAVAAISAGSPLGEATLREAMPEVILDGAASASETLGRRPLAPGEVRPFEAIMLAEQLPDQARRVLLEVGEPESRPIARESAAGAPDWGTTPASGSVTGQLDAESDFLSP